tara:strand:+ start:306 stop:521 length:216 start_codon:yes stop_codon:yes gene_type:complete
MTPLTQANYFRIVSKKLAKEITTNPKIVLDKWSIALYNIYKKLRNKLVKMKERKWKVSNNHFISIKNVESA